MDALVTMSAPPALAAHQPSLLHQARELAPLDSLRARQTTISVRSPTSAAATGDPRGGFPHKETSAGPAAAAVAGATVFVAGSRLDGGDLLPAIASSRILEVQLANGSSSREPAAAAAPLSLQKPPHVVKIRINPGCDSSTSARVVSAVRLNLEDVPTGYELSSSGIASNNSVIVHAKNNNHISHSDHDDIDNNNRKDISHNVISVNGNSAGSAVGTKPCVRISVKSNGCDYFGSESSSEDLQGHASIRTDHAKDVDMVQQRHLPESLNVSRASSSCFYYSSPLSTIVMSSGQCSPSETLDSGTCSDLDGTPPPLPKKKSSSTVMVEAGGTTTAHLRHHHPHQRHNRTGSLTSSGAEVDSDDNESSISCDSLNSGEVPLNGNVKFRVSRSLELRTAKQHRLDKENFENGKTDTNEANRDVVSEDFNISNGHLHGSELININESRSSKNKSPNDSPPASGTSTLSKAPSTPRIKSPETTGTRRSFTCSTASASAPVVNECTYEERRREQEYNSSGSAADGLVINEHCNTKYIYEDDRYYKFHVNEREARPKIKSNKNWEKNAENDDECFAGYKILEREAIRSAKGTVRGVKNRVRAGIATFLQKPSSKVSVELLYFLCANQYPRRRKFMRVRNGNCVKLLGNNSYVLVHE